MVGVIREVLAVIGMGLLVAGVALLSIPASLILAGTVAVLVAMGMQPRAVDR